MILNSVGAGSIRQSDDFLVWVEKLRNPAVAGPMIARRMLDIMGIRGEESEP